MVHLTLIDPKGIKIRTRPSESDFVPRKSDILTINDCRYKVLSVEVNYDGPVSVFVYLEPNR